MAEALTQKKLDNLKPKAARYEIADAPFPGLSGRLRLVVQPLPSKEMSWIVRYRHNGRSAKLTLGRYSRDTKKIGLADARKRARDALELVQQGIDPAAVNRAKRTLTATAATDTVPAVVEEFLKRHVRPNNRSADETERLLLKEVCEPWRRLLFSEISRRDIVKLMDGIIERGSPYTANRVFSLIRKMGNWGIERGLITASPVHGMKPPAVEESRDRILTDDEVRRFWKASDSAGYPFGPVFQLLLLTAQRRDEVSGMRRSEVNWDTATWTLPKERSKNGRAHEVPLSSPALEILRAVPRTTSDLFFSTTGETAVSGFSRAKERLDAVMLALAPESDGEASIPDWRLHDLRRTAASGMARLGLPVHVVEAVLAYKSGTIRGVAAVYNRYSYADEKRRALEAWARFVTDQVQGKAATYSNLGRLVSANDGSRRKPGGGRGRQQEHFRQMLYHYKFNINDWLAKFLTDSARAGDTIIHGILVDWAAAFLRAGIELPKDVREYVADFIKNPKPVRGRGRRSFDFEDRNFYVVIAVWLLQHRGYQYTRTSTSANETSRRETACSIVSKALNNSKCPMGERMVEKIWEKHRFTSILHKLDAEQSPETIAMICECWWELGSDDPN